MFLLTSLLHAGKEKPSEIARVTNLGNDFFLFNATDIALLFSAD